MEIESYIENLLEINKDTREFFVCVAAKNTRFTISELAEEASKRVYNMLKNHEDFSNYYSDYISFKVNI